MSGKLNFEQIKEQLLQRRQELVEHSNVDTGLEAEVDQVKDAGDEANLLSAEKLQHSLNETEFGEIKKIDQALKKLEKGTYGQCEDCEGQISSARLDFYPYAARCIVCQEAAES